MGIPPQFFFGLQGGGQGRRVGADGMISVKCLICEKTICRELYRGYSTAICAVCSGQLEQGKTALELMEQAREQEQKEVQGLAEDLGPLGFKVTGLGERMKDVVKKVKTKAAVRRRKPLFASKDKV